MAQEGCPDPTSHTVTTPLQPGIPRPFTFLSLPREIRDAIYTLALVSPSPIVIWKGEWVYEQQGTFSDSIDLVFPHHAPFVWRRAIDPFASKSTLHSLSTNLLFCSSIINQEAAAVFYKKTTFSFLGAHNWDPVVRWLKTTGPQNRNHLFNLDVSARTPEQVWQHSNGERTEHPGMLTREVIYPRNAHLHVPVHPVKCGLVDNINPALETIFQLLGQRTSTQKITLNFKLCGEYPGQGAILSAEDQRPENAWHSMDLPNLVEKFRTLYTCRAGDSQPLVEVHWQGEYHPYTTVLQNGSFGRVQILDHLQNLEDHGWQMNVSPEEEDETVSKPRDKSPNISTFVLKRKKLDEPLMGDEPNPYSNIYMTEEREACLLDRHIDVTESAAGEVPGEAADRVSCG